MVSVRVGTMVILGVLSELVPRPLPEQGVPILY